ncbi:uncharacterized protein LOC110979417 [Acanthaster planci]|uniref:Uncharacterized protein LOC110979417 n=1 Tax=Acanthaster planci TaxID=133434 RepID=A0A8B7YCB3_ACAPL|nr:uncharacterized protein LOC110979417 [Acanthaster planci]
MKNSEQPSLASWMPAGAYPHHGQAYRPMASSQQPVHIQGVSTLQRFAIQRKSLLEAYIYCFLFGLFGVHHFYLKRNLLGWLYLFSLGLLGVGWLIDLIRLPWLVAKANQEEEEMVRNGYCVARQYNYRFYDLRERTLLEAYIMWFPMGLFGFHHFYLGRTGFGVIYAFSAGLAGIGWLTDIFRMPYLVRETNEKIRKLRNGEVVEITMECSVGDAYQLAFPLGILGLHHFYMGRVGQGLAYLCTGGLAGVGWLADLVRMPCLVSRHNREVQENRTWTRHLDDAYIYAVPFGILGFHRFYLSGPAIGLLYFFTAGIFTIGWLVDLVRMPCLVQAANKRERLRCEMYTNLVIPNNERLYVFIPGQGTPGHGQGQPPLSYGTANQTHNAQLPYATQQGGLPYYLNQNHHMPVPANPVLSPYGVPPPNPPQYEGIAEPEPSPLPPPYQETSDSSCQQTMATPAPPVESKFGESQA